MYGGELIVYVEEDRNRKYKCALTTIHKIKKIIADEGIKIIYFEIHKNPRTAKERSIKMQSLSHLRLEELIKGANPELLNLIKCI